MIPRVKYTYPKETWVPSVKDTCPNDVIVTEVDPFFAEFAKKIKAKKELANSDEHIRNEIARIVNALKHGISKGGDSGKVSVTSKVVNSKVEKGVKRYVGDMVRINHGIDSTYFTISW